MKRLAIFLFMAVLSNSIKAQSTYISSDSKQSCFWNATDQKFSQCGNVDDFESMFTLNQAETMFIHTTKTMKSSYYVKDKTYLAETDAYSYNVISDVGNKYQFILGKNSANFVILSTGHADTKEDYIIKFPIKKKWAD